MFAAKMAAFPVSDSCCPRLIRSPSNTPTFPTTQQINNTTNNQTNERNKTMKLTKNQIKEKQEELVETILKLDALGKQKKSLVAILDDDFNENEAKYRNGIVTPKGVLMRKPRWDVVAKGIVEVA
jgi:hypothetical protein